LKKDIILGLQQYLEKVEEGYNPRTSVVFREG
jgi:hypothetical protein